MAADFANGAQREETVHPQSLPPRRTATIGEQGKRKWVYADLPRGRFTRARLIVMSALVVFYVIAPFLSVGGHPLLRFDLPHRRFSLFGATFMAADLYLLALFLIAAVVGLFLFSALLGRLWCGWMCPQTVYLEGVFRRLEGLLEGTRLKRSKRDGGPRDGDWWMRKIAKHSGFLIISAVMSLAFVAYFVGPQVAYGMAGDLGAGHRAAFITALVLTALTYWNFSSFREQFCTFLCPYARFQSVMLDDHSLIVGYDPVRGEPRGAIRPNQTFENRGDCIDCKRCVQVCPTGIDIRDGLQLECVSCTACIDACDAVMDRIGRPRGLVRYDSLAGLARRAKRILRARVVLYSALVLVLVTLLTARVIGRDVVALSVTRAPGIPYLVQADGKVRNLFSLHFTNSDARAKMVTVEFDGPNGAELLVPGQPFEVPSGGRVSAEAFVIVPRELIGAAHVSIAFRVMENGKMLSRAQAIFLGPVRNPAK